MEIDSMDGSNWLADYGYVEDEVDFFQPSSGFASWASPAFGCSSDLSVEVNYSFTDSDSLKMPSCRKRLKPDSCNALGSKAGREKTRRDKLNERFLELTSILEPGKPPKTDKAVILSDAVRTVTQLRAETEELKESNGQLQEKIKELKAEKNELRDEKQRLKADKEKLEQQVKAMSVQMSYLPHLSAMFAAQGQATSNKLMPYIGFPGAAMWQFMSPSVIDTSQDHVQRPPAA
ncbi:transcription factor ILR3-like [Punica granatum]|uniref:Transcription factor ILR3-like n=1 Tax=Punica granatum TaxID=22663 RepID=A0A6P8CN03_PUNGR|nr:transcription factor ILR3-like [Punica granatum]